MTAAHRSLPFGTRVRVTHLGNGRSVDVHINDRGPYVGGRIIDLSQGAAGVLGMHGQGVAHVQGHRARPLRRQGPSENRTADASASAVVVSAAPRERRSAGGDQRLPRINFSILADLRGRSPHVPEHVVLAAAARHVELDVDVAGAEAEEAKAQDLVHDEIVAALDHLEVERAEGLELARERRVPAHLSLIDHAIGQARVNEGGVEPDGEARSRTRRRRRRGSCAP